MIISCSQIFDTVLNCRLNICDGGFGGQKQCWTDLSDGYLSYSTSDPTNGTQVVDDLASLLTSGRLSEHHRNLIEELYSNHQNKAEALKLAQQLIVLSPEFSALGISRETQEKRPELASPTKTCQEYKAVVHILLKGGCDSFNLLVPHSRCSDRGERALRLLFFRYNFSFTLIILSSSSQICTMNIKVFGVPLDCQKQICCKSIQKTQIKCVIPLASIPTSQSSKIYTTTEMQPFSQVSVRFQSNVILHQTRP